MKKISVQKNFVSGMENIIPAKNDTPYKRIIAIGDVHGEFTKLMSLWDKLSVSELDKVIFLGDLIDRGHEVAKTLKWILEQSKKPNVVLVRGNHEQMMLDTFQKRMNKLTWFFNGGRTTIQGLSELKSEDETFIERILEFAEKLPLYHAMTIGGREYIFVHAGIEEGVPLNEQSEDFLLWAREEFFDSYNGEAVIIGGHSPVQAFKKFGVADNPRPIKLPGKNIILTDTGSFIRGGKISAVDLLSGHFYQSDTE